MRWILIALLLLPLTLSAQPNYYPDYWFSYTSVDTNRALAHDSTISNHTPSPLLIGENSLFVTWQKEFTGVVYQIYDQYGVPQFDEPQLMATMYNDNWSWSPRCVTDGEGGAFVNWKYGGLADTMRYCVQRISSSGERLWGDNGILVLDGFDSEGLPKVSPDGIGGLIIGYDDENVLKAVSLDADGNFNWGAEPVVICQENNWRDNLEVTHDENGGAYFAWRDYRTTGVGRVFMQYVNYQGRPQWEENGIGVYWLFTAWLNQLVPDDAGGCILYTGSGSFNRVLRINPQGQTVWEQIGYRCGWGIPALLIKGSEGYFYLYSYNDEYRWWLSAQMMDMQGQTYWSGSDPMLHIANVANTNPFWELSACYQNSKLYVMYQIFSDGFVRCDLYSQCIAEDGQLLWGNDMGSHISQRYEVYNYFPIVPDNQDGMIAILNGMTYFHGKHINADGTLGGPKPVKIEPRLYPAIESTGSNSLTFTLPTPSHITIDLFNILGQRVQTISEGFKEAGSYSIRLDERYLASGIYLARLQAGADVKVVKIAVVR